VSGILTIAAAYQLMIAITLMGVDLAFEEGK